MSWFNIFSTGENEPEAPPIKDQKYFTQEELEALASDIVSY
jgi:hypothetical protein